MADRRFQRDSRQQNDRIDNMHHSDRNFSDRNDYQSSRSMSYRPQEDRGTGRYTSDFPRYGSSSSDLGYDNDFYDRKYYGDNHENFSVRDYRNYSSGRSTSDLTPSYSGRGPKGWKRSDERIREDVCERLERDAHIDASEIEVSVNDGIVSLTGHAETRRAKRHAEDIIENLSGVRDVTNSLTVDQSLFEQAKEFFTGDSKPTGGKAGKGPSTSSSSEKLGSRH